MGWISQRVETLREAFTLRRVFAISIFIAVIHGAASAVEWIANGENLLGAPPWVYAAFAGLLVVICLLIEHANRLRVDLEPKFKISFNPDAEGVAQTPTEIRIMEGDAIKTILDEAIYMRITVDCLSKATIKECVAFITKIEKRLPSAKEFSGIRLHGRVPLLSAPRIVYASIPSTIDFLKSGEHDNKFDCNLAQEPFYMRGMFDDPATYRFTLQVNGDGITKEMRIDVNWSGQWNTISARQV